MLVVYSLKGQGELERGGGEGGGGGHKSAGKGGGGGAPSPALQGCSDGARSNGQGGTQGGVRKYGLCGKPLECGKCGHFVAQGPESARGAGGQPPFSAPLSLAPFAAAPPSSSPSPHFP